jgi:hypothetical protein
MVLSIRRIVSVLGVAALMAALVVAMAAPAFAQAAEGIGGGAGEGKLCNAGHGQESTAFAPGQVKKQLAPVTCPA